jgi:hypothetical protein
MDLTSLEEMDLIQNELQVIQRDVTSLIKSKQKKSTALLAAELNDVRPGSMRNKRQLKRESAFNRRARTERLPVLVANQSISERRTRIHTRVQGKVKRC